MATAFRSAAAAKSSNAANLPPGVIDMDTFNQILELDDDDPDQTFSRETVVGYFQQAKSTFDDMDKAFAEKNLENLSHLGHFLKGSSAQLGINKVHESCEEMQNVGLLKDGSGRMLGYEEALSMMDVILKRVKVEHEEAERCLKSYFNIVD